MKIRMALIIGMAMVLGLWGSGNAVIIHFDDMAGMQGPFYDGQPISPQYMVDDEYLSQGVRFDSGGGGIRVARAGNAVSRPNLVSGTAMGPHKGPISDYDAHVYASFWVDGAPALVDRVGLTVSNFNGAGVLEAYSLDGALLGTIDSQGSPRLDLNFPGQIHSVTFIPNHAAFDNFTFEGLNKVPVPAAFWLLGSGLIGIARIRYRPKK